MVAGHFVVSDGIQHLLTWLSPAFPIGAFAWSGGLEAAELKPTDLPGWLETSLTRGPLWNDAVLLAAAHRGEPGGEDDVDELAVALAGSRLRRDETVALGEGFAAVVGPWEAIEARSYPVAVGRAARTHDLETVLVAFLQAGIVNQVQCAQRLMPLGQRRAMGVIADLEPVVARIAAKAAGSTTDDLGGCAFGIDMAAMRHETRPSRIFRS